MQKDENSELARIFHHTGSEAGGKSHECRLAGHRNENRFLPVAFTRAYGNFAASSHPRFAPGASAVGLARGARICAQTSSSSSRDPV